MRPTYLVVHTGGGVISSAGRLPASFRSGFGQAAFGSQVHINVAGDLTTQPQAGYGE